MNLTEFLSNQENEHKRQGNPHVNCNALYKTRTNFNCYLTAGQAIELAGHLLQKAKLIVDHQIEGAVVQLWNEGERNERIYVGMNQARKGGRRKAVVKKAVARAKK
jgi:hypothetical protein